MSERDTRSFIRRWNREIEDEIRRAAQQNAAHGPWKAVVWGVIWLIWLVLLAVFALHIRGL